jgi:integrase
MGQTNRICVDLRFAARCRSETGPTLSTGRQPIPSSCSVRVDLNHAFHSRCEAVARKVTLPRGKLLSVLQAYQDSGDSRGLAANTRRSYIALIKRIEKAFGDFPLAAVTDRRSRGVFLARRDRLAVNARRRQADYAWTVLARVFSWSFDRGLVLDNPCKAGGRLYRGGSRAENIRTADVETAFLERASKHLHLALMLALWTGQRQGDLLRLPWSAYNGTHIRLRQSKSGVRVVIQVGAPLKAALDAASKRSTSAMGERADRVPPASHPDAPLESFVKEQRSLIRNTLHSSPRASQQIHGSLHLAGGNDSSQHAGGQRTSEDHRLQGSPRGRCQGPVPVKLAEPVSAHPCLPTPHNKATNGAVAQRNFESVRDHTERPGGGRSAISRRGTVTSLTGSSSEAV